MTGPAPAGLPSGGLDLPRLERALAALPGAWVLHHADTVTSTNATAKAFLPAPAVAPATHCFLAEVQTRGRGRLGRRWESPRGLGLYLTLRLPEVAGPPPSLLPLAAGVAVAAAVRTVTGLPVRLRWPNDLWLEARKLGGILVEAVASEGRVQALVVGIGLNVNQGPDALPPEGTSLRLATGRSWEREALLIAIWEAWETWWARLRAGDGAAVRAAWEAASDVTVHTRVLVAEEGGTEEGWVEGLSPEGNLRVRTAAGALRVVTSAASVRYPALDGAPTAEAAPGRGPA